MISASILSADFARLGEAVAAAEDAGVGEVHVDVMDGCFVPNLTMGPVVVGALRRVTRLPLDVHLMTCRPESLFPAFAEAGADRLTFHLEATPHPHRLLGEIRRLGLEAGVAINPGTPVGHLRDLLPETDRVLLMSVNPGFAGQRFIPQTLPRLAELAALRSELGLGFEIAVDGGVKPENARALVERGAGVLVAASSVFNQRPVAENLAEFRRALAG